MRFVGSSKLRSEDKTVDTKTELDATNFIVCSVFFLDDYEHKFQLPKTAIGEELLNEVFTFLELTERDYFGLQFVCVTGSHSIVRMKWLDGKKSIKRQMMTAPYHLFFRLKFYPSDPTKLCEELTLYHIYLQVRKDLADGRLPCNSEEMAAILGSYAVQSEFGDYSSSEHGDNYLGAFRLLPTQTPGLLKKIRELHALRVGQSPAEAEFHFLTKAKCLDLYGFDLFQSKDGYNRSITIGVNSNGISVFDNNSSRVHSFPWATIIKLSFKRKNFLLQILTADENAFVCRIELTQSSVLMRFLLKTVKCFGRVALNITLFFRLVKPPNANVNVVRSLFHLQSRFRYSGRTEYQTMEENRRRGLNTDRKFARPSNLQASRPSTKTKSAISSTESVSINDQIETTKVNGRRPKDNKPSTTKPTKLEQSATSTISPSSTDTINGTSSINSGSCTRGKRRSSSLMRSNVFRKRIDQLSGISSSASALIHNFLSISTSHHQTTTEVTSIEKENTPTIADIPISTSISQNSVPSDPKISSNSSVASNDVDSGNEERIENTEESTSDRNSTVSAR
ncbi:Moesin/ezrin/radixin-like protein 1 [Aphelenchoides besseyi]|nr:Moesin/ezrin/radixin-like protein 1 [Aphelenchoides besseyi]